MAKRFCKHLFLSSLILPILGGAVLGGCGNFAQLESLFGGLPVVKVDDEHSGIGKEGNQPLVNYVVAQGKGFILDASGYKFNEAALPPGARTDHKMIHLIVGDHQIYGIDWDSNAERYTLNKDTLKPLYGSPPYSELRAGQRLMVGIGYEEIDRVAHRAIFAPLWCGVVEVR